MQAGSDGDTGDPREPQTSQRVDVSAVTAMLSAKWKGGGQSEPWRAKSPEKDAVKPGQIRTFKIATLDAQQKRIQLELA